MMTYDLELRGAQPKYEYLSRCILSDIRSGALAADERLPSKRVLAEHLGVSVTTVENAYTLLVSEGHLYTRSKHGFFVSPRPAPPPAPAERSEAAEQYLFDFKANRCSMSLFPLNTWTRLMRKVLSDQDDELLQTVPFRGLLVLRRAIADYLYGCRGMSVSPGQIVVGAGTEYLYGKLLQLFGPQSVIAIEEPGYKKFAEISNSYGTLWDYIPMDESGIRTDVLARSRANVVHVSPGNHFPTGTVMPAARRRELLEWAREAPDRYLIEDDYDSELRFSGQALPTLFSQDGRKVIYMNTFSKSLVPSLRISYMVLPEALMELYESRMSFYSCSVSSFEQYTLAKFISQGYFERHINRLRRHYRRRKELMEEALAASPLASVCDMRRCSVGTHMVLRMDTRLSDGEIRRRAGEAGVHLALMSDYCLVPSIAYSGQVVLNFASVEPEQIPMAVRQLERIFSGDIDLKKLS